MPEAPFEMIPAHPFVNNSKGQAMDEATTRDHIQKHADASCGETWTQS